MSYSLNIFLLISAIYEIFIDCIFVIFAFLDKRNFTIILMNSMKF